MSERRLRKVLVPILDFTITLGVIQIMSHIPVGEIIRIEESLSEPKATIAAFQTENAAEPTPTKPPPPTEVIDAQREIARLSPRRARLEYEILGGMALTGLSIAAMSRLNSYRDRASLA